MICPKCGSTHSSFINQPIQLKKKTKSFTMEFLTTIFTIAFIIGLILYLAITRDNPKDADLSQITIYVVATKMMSESAKALILIGIINAVRPHKMTNKIVFACLACGYTVELRQQPIDNQTKIDQSR